MVENFLNIEVNKVVKKRRNNKTPIYNKSDKIQKFIEEWNTIEGVELYKPLYEICSLLFLATQEHKLKCLNYYIDEEDKMPVMYAEIKDTWNLSLKRRYELHIDLLARVEENDPTLEYVETSVIQENESGQLSLFG